MQLYNDAIKQNSNLQSQYYNNKYLYIYKLIINTDSSMKVSGSIENKMYVTW